MTEQEWLECTNLEQLIKTLNPSGQGRKLRLFACACARRLWHLFPDGKGQEAIKVAERFADGIASVDELVKTERSGRTAWAESGMSWITLIWGGQAVAMREASDAALHVIAYAPSAATVAGAPHRKKTMSMARRAHHALFRDVFFNPFRPPSISAFLRNSTVLALAQAAYEDRTLPAGTLDPDRLAILADALEDAGCDDADILGHLRGPGPHVRGCWALDLVLGKK
jgi:hypothetical protein